MSAAGLMGAAVGIPLLAALVVPALGRRPNLREGASLLAAALAFACAARLLPDVLAGDRPEWRLLEFLPGVELVFRLEPLGLGFALIASFLWFVTVVYAIGYMRVHGERNQTRFYSFFALAIASTLGAAFAGNLLTLYLFYEALTLATYPLVTHGGTDKDRAGGRTYLAVLLGTSLSFLLLALAWTYVLAGTLDFVAGGLFLRDGRLPPGVTPAVLATLYALFLFGTGKAALMPFHRWLPAAMVAPTPVSALLHAVAVVKLGVFTVLKLTVYTFGTDVFTLFDVGRLMQYVAAATLLIAAALALREDNLKRRLAYSTISQLAYIVLAAALANRLSLLAGGMHIAAHAFAKITLFFCAGAILVSLHKTRVSELCGVGRVMPVTMGAWLVASLAIIGLPLTGGFWSKWYLAQGAFAAGDYLLMGVVLLGSLLAMGYLLPPAVRAFYTPAGNPDGETGAVLREAPWPSLVALGLTAVLSILLFFAAQPVFEFLEGFAG